MGFPHRPSGLGSSGTPLGGAWASCPFLRHCCGLLTSPWAPVLLWACGDGWCPSFLCWGGEQLGWGVTWTPSPAIASLFSFMGEQPSSWMDNPAGQLFNSLLGSCSLESLLPPKTSACSFFLIPVFSLAFCEAWSLVSARDPAERCGSHYRALDNLAERSDE